MPADQTTIPDPKLIEQLTLLRDEYGEGFDEDIATPLAKIVKTLRTGFKAMHDEHEREWDKLAEERDTAQQELEDLRETQAVFDDLEDLRRGVLSAEELYERHLDFTPVSV